MSNSRKKTPIVGMTNAPSDKPFKRAEHSRERAAVRVALAQGEEQPHGKQFGDLWNGEKDGKQFVADNPELLRK